MYNTLVVTDQTEAPLLDLNVITFDQYLEDYPKLAKCGRGSSTSAIQSNT